MEWKKLHAAIEGLLFAAGDPLPIQKLCEVLGETQESIKTALSELGEDYRKKERGLRLIRLEESYQMVSAPEYADLIRDMMEKKEPNRLSPPALEVLTIVAYYQPVTRAYVEQVRGVDSAYTLGLLVDRELIEESGRLDLPGRPILYRTTPHFLRAFHLQSLEELPELPVLAEEDKTETGGD